MAQHENRPGSAGSPIDLLRAWWSVPTYRFAGSFLLYLAAMALAFPFLRIRLAVLFHLSEVVTAEIVHGPLSLFRSNTRIAGRTVLSLGRFSVTILE